MNTLTILDKTGDTKLTWDQTDPASCQKARDTVAALKAQGYSFFLVDGNPADEVTAGSGEIVVRKLAGDEVVVTVAEPSESTPKPSESVEPGLCQCGKKQGHRGRCPKTGRSVVAVRPIAGG
jgi:hypothetical protein